MNHFLFVYGMLRKGGGASLPDSFPGSRFVANASVEGTLFDLGEFPGILLEVSDAAVIGEIYEVDAETLSALDEFEATANYSRVETSVSIEGKPSTCWVYCPAPDRCLTSKRIDSGDWIEYVKSRSL